MKLGTVLVLFILLVIVTSVFYSPVQERSPENTGPGILASSTFYVYNETANFTMAGYDFSGSFEEPLPDPRNHIIVPGRRSIFQLIAPRCSYPPLVVCTGSGVAPFSIINPQGNQLGYVHVKLSLLKISGGPLTGIGVDVFSAPVVAVTQNGNTAIIRDI
ncbi:hypothetical protein [Paenibacillus herberti]|uniref:Uncharacterized protein n=1 Tax=Paenibacillus herberti TaxID=1619309 RepID=A0A229NXN1_9BACL|nr:hypothetical protein [Paenibacillus herberti]OXM14389.1 hypothetical protein CGZ75_15700 [Paenibacillus herberti]